MPTYAYKCRPNGHPFEVTKMVARVAESETCPECGAVCGPDCRDYRAENVIVNGMEHVRYPYVSKRLGGTAGAKFCKEVPVTRAGVTMTGHVVESRQHEREICARTGMTRE